MIHRPLSMQTKRANKNLRFLERLIAGSAAVIVFVVSYCGSFDKFGYKGLLVLLTFSGFSTFVFKFSENSPGGSR